MNRTAGAGKRLAKQARAKFIGRSQLKKLAFDVIINATPVGMGNGKDSLLNEKEIKARYLLEMVYSGGETRLAKLARLAGAEVIPGVEMFVHQGARQFEIWTGKPAPVDEMRHVVVTALEARAREKELANVKYPMASDTTGKIARQFGVYDEGSGLALRGTFVINPEGVIKVCEIHDNGIGRDASELLRKVKAAQYVANHPGEVCPAKWQEGAATLKPSLDLVGKI